jgi:hypothetical protein
MLQYIVFGKQPENEQTALEMFASEHVHKHIGAVRSVEATTEEHQ